ncbi:OprO/OprP family phosphate-selective porin [Sphingobacterium sp. lm-10]|uniref:porin n=1 Tax=Sphingobacterium sp. lm-10 TaxID=2944904 RepID=UPI002021FBC2|nr:OprO/OprP family phosphate-selective porin [Sphingobacterium sp. lm-10]
MKNLLIILFAFSTLTVQAQVTVASGDHVVEIGTVLSSYLNFRTIKPDASNQNQNNDRFRLRDARFYISGRIGNDYEYKLQADLSSLGAREVDPETPALYDAYIKYKGFKPFNITAGYGKLPYSRFSMVAFKHSPYWQRAQVVRGDLFSRRDVGVMLDKSLWNQQINIYAGVYTGVGELFLQGDNDPSGAFEYVGRIDFAFPSRYRYQDIDTKISPVPMFAIGANTRYSNRNLPEGASFISGHDGRYGIKVINGKKLGVGIDATFQYQGFSAQFESQLFKATPQHPDDPNLRGLPPELTNGYFKFGGLVAQANYFFKPAKTIISGRYEELNLNDLIPGSSQRLSGAIAFQINGFRSMIKAQYFNILREESIDPLRWTEQFRIGWQFVL